MATPWDRAHPDTSNSGCRASCPTTSTSCASFALHVGQRVLVVSAGPGAEVVAAARAVDLEGYVRATDKSEEMVRLCRDRLEGAGFDKVRCEVADAADTAGGPWDVVLCAFGLWQLDGDRARGSFGRSPRDAAVSAWAESLTPSGQGRRAHLGAVRAGRPVRDPCRCAPRGRARIIAPPTSAPACWPSAARSRRFLESRRSSSLWFATPSSAIR